jgi:Flp pilus assembly protein TadG
MRRITRQLAKLLRDRRGNALVIGAAAMPLLVGGAAAAVDTIQLSVAKRQLQRAADSAALAGAYGLAQDRSIAESVTHALALNNQIPLTGAPTIENAPTAGPNAGDIRAVRVVLAVQSRIPFMAFFTGQHATVTAEATAAIVFAGQYCVISLEEDSVTGVTFTGNTSANLGCGVVTNARGVNAVVAEGSSQVWASPVAAVGGVPNGNYMGDTKLLPYAPPQDDPYAHIPDPVVPSSCNGAVRVQPNTTATIAPGCYASLDIKGTAIFGSGTYIINGGELGFGATARASGSEVTFVLTSRQAATSPSSVATVDMHGNAVVDFTSPTSGTYEGILIYQDRRASYDTVTINGNSASRFEGGFYFPGRRLVFNGNAGLRSECMQLVARRVVFSGNSKIENECPTDGGAQAYDATFVRLVG